MLGYAAIVAAAIAAQHAMSKNTDRRFGGQATKDAFGGSYMTEPWLSFAYQKMGIGGASAGEDFDAAWQNKDQDKMAKTLPRAMGYWLEPGTSVGYDVVKDKIGSSAANVIFPNQWGFDKLGGFLNNLF
jgi:hypothetical protein